jgi:hypothetical protein
MQNRNDILRGLAKWIMPELRGTVVSHKGNLMVPVEPKERTGFRMTKKPRTIRVGTGQYNTLKYIWQAGEEGRRYTDIQLFLIGGEERVARGTQSKRVNDVSFDLQNPERGHYSPWLSYSMPNYCTKNSRGNWVLTDRNLLAHFNNMYPDLAR